MRDTDRNLMGILKGYHTYEKAFVKEEIIIFN